MCFQWNILEIFLNLHVAGMNSPASRVARRSCGVCTPARSSAATGTWWLWCSTAQSRARTPGTRSNTFTCTTTSTNQVRGRAATKGESHGAESENLCPFRCEAGPGRGCSAGRERRAARSAGPGEWGDVSGRCPVVLRQPLQRHQAAPLAQTPHDLHLQGRSARGRRRQGPTGPH